MHKLGVSELQLKHNGGKGTLALNSWTVREGFAAAASDAAAPSLKQWQALHKARGGALGKYVTMVSDVPPLPSWVTGSCQLLDVLAGGAELLYWLLQKSEVAKCLADIVPFFKDAPAARGEQVKGVHSQVQSSQVFDTFAIYMGAMFYACLYLICPALNSCSNLSIFY